MSTWMAEVRACVNKRLAAYLEEKQAEAETLSPESLELVTAVRDLTMRGGKRLRAGVLASGFAAARGSLALESIVDMCASLELLQTYLLIHDDWMDGDEERRGGPSVHTALTRQHGDAQRGAAIAVLAGDLAAAYAWELFHRAPFPAGYERQGIEVFLSIHKEVFFGQHLDLIASHDVPRVHRLKTDSYTVRGPMLLGAALGGIDDGKRAALVAIAEPLGLAFQLRDDILGTFGDASATGKPAGNDLRSGKRTALIWELEQAVPGVDQGPVRSVLGRADASEDEVRAAVEFLRASGALARVEARLLACSTTARSAIDALAVPVAAKSMLRDVSMLLTERNH